MKPSELFGVFVRTMGLFLILAALWKIFLAILNLVGGGPQNVLGMLLYGVLMLLVGLWFLRGPKALISFAFPERTCESRS